MPAIETKSQSAKARDGEQLDDTGHGALAATVRPADRAGRHPIAAGAAVWLLSFAVLTAILMATGFVITHLLSHSVGRWDDHVNAWFARHRDSTGNRVSGDFTLLANAPGIVGGAVIAATVVTVKHRLRYGLMLVAALVMELAVFLTVNYAVRRPRPHVRHLGSTPSTYSWPSGHVGATLVLYGAIAMITVALTSRLWPRIIAWVFAAAMVSAVALSRVYRGDHHPTDTLAGVAMGAAALWGTHLAIRAWEDATGRRRSSRLSR